MRKIIVLITSSFPYGKGENFLEKEMEFIKCDKLIIIPLSPVGDIRAIKSKTDYEVLPISKNTKGQRLVGFLIDLLSCGSFVTDLFSITKRRRMSLLATKKSLSFTSHGVTYSRKAIKLLKPLLNHEDQICFYSYWLLLTAYVAIGLRNHFGGIAITRCHGGDLYEERDSTGTLPMRDFLLGSLDLIYCISKNGEDYLTKKYPKYATKYKLSRLGSVDVSLLAKQESIARRKSVFKIVSCSWLTHVKRVDRIISILGMITGKNIEWTHFGGGELSDILHELAHNELDGRVVWNITGTLKHDDILLEYEREEFHLFINVSSSEGLPVSIMEACANCIPVIATDVGGVSEIVSNGVNGFLVNKDFEDTEVVKLIEDIIHMSELEYNLMRKNARFSWEEKFSASRNYTRFYNDIIWGKK